MDQVQNKSTDGAGAQLRALVAAATDVGRVRSSNEDAFVVASLGAPIAAPLTPGTDAEFPLEPVPLLLAVSDGMGGAAAGEIASALVVASLRRSLPAASDDWNTTIKAAVDRANREVWSAGRAPERRGMGATLTAVCIHGLAAHVAEVGDSRAYRLTAGKLEQITRDQSYVQMLLDAGAISPAEAADSPMKNVILTAMGTEPNVRVELGQIALRPGDRVLVCCDGLSNEVPPEIIARELGTATAPSIACARLIQLANEHGGKDNITVVAAFIEEVGA